MFFAFNASVLCLALAFVALVGGKPSGPYNVQPMTYDADQSYDVQDVVKKKLF